MAIRKGGGSGKCCTPTNKFFSFFFFLKKPENKTLIKSNLLETLQFFMLKLRNYQTISDMRPVR